jgi:hypothetical protein
VRYPWLRTRPGRTPSAGVSSPMTIKNATGADAGWTASIPANAINGTIFTLGCSVGVTATGATGYDHACAEHDVGFTEGFKRSSASPPQPERLVLHRLLCAQQRPLTCRVRVRVHSKKPACSLSRSTS